MLRHNPGGGLEEAAIQKVVARSREMFKVQRKVELNEIFDLSMAKEADAEMVTLGEETKEDRESGNRKGLS
jgi:hypothetical protein